MTTVSFSLNKYFKKNMLEKKKHFNLKIVFKKVVKFLKLKKSHKYGGTC